MKNAHLERDVRFLFNAGMIYTLAMGYFIFVRVYILTDSSLTKTFILAEDKSHRI